MESALRLLFQALSPPEQEHRVAYALHLVQSGELDPQGIFLTRESASVTGAQVCLPIVGANALIWPPQSVPGSLRESREDILIQHACAWLRSRGVKLAQCLLAPEELHQGIALLRNGFVHLTHLWYLRHDPDIPVALLATPVQLSYQTYDENQDLFHEVLLRSYIGTLDCPEVNELRTVDEIVAGHQAQGPFDPHLWWLAVSGDRPVGVVLVSVLAESGDWDVAYLGVVPEERRRGHAREMMLKVLFEARAAGVTRVSLCVDGRNEPARNLYRTLGFEPYDRREVLLAIWRPV
jgi:ribosomal protein S18 acetylase RimI-like enzyme